MVNSYISFYHLLPSVSLEVVNTSIMGYNTRLLPISISKVHSLPIEEPAIGQLVENGLGGLPVALTNFRVFPI